MKSRKIRRIDKFELNQKLELVNNEEVQSVYNTLDMLKPEDSRPKQVKNTRVIHIGSEQKMKSIICKAVGEGVKVVEIDGNNIIKGEDYAAAIKSGFGDNLNAEWYWDDRYWEFSPNNDNDGNRVPEYQAHLIGDLSRMGTTCVYIYRYNGDRCSDWRHYVKDGRYMLVIYSYHNFMRSDVEYKKRIIDDFNEIILPRWDGYLSRMKEYDSEKWEEINRRKGVYFDSKKYKNVKSLFNVYLVD